MTTTKLYSNGTGFGRIYFVALKNQLPFAMVTAILMLLVLTVATLVSAGHATHGMIVDDLTREEMARLMENVYIDGFYTSSDIPFFAAAVLAALSVVSVLVGTTYLHRKSMVDFYHVLPVKRPILLFSHLAASITAVAVPFAVVYLGTAALHLLLYGKYGVFDSAFFAFVAVDWLLMLTYIVVLCSLTTLVAVNAGTIFDTFLITGAVGLAPSILLLSFTTVWSSLIYGASSGRMNTLIYIASPFFFPLSHLRDYGRLDSTPAVAVLLVWIAVAAALIVLACVCYNKRGSELAEQIRSWGAAQILAKCIACLCGGILLFLFFDGYYYPLAVRLAAMFFGGLVVGIVAEVVLARGIRSLLRGLKWLAGSSLLCCLLVLLVSADPTGYVTRLPALEDVRSVSVNYRGRFEDQTDKMVYSPGQEFTSYMGYGRAWGYTNNGGIRLTSPISIQTVLDMHRAAVEDVVVNKYDMDWENVGYRDIQVEYTLNSGKVMRREFGIMNLGAYRELVNLEDREDFIRESHSVFFTGDNLKFTQAEQISYISVRDGLGVGSAQKAFLAEEELDRLFEAVQYDMLDEAFDEIIHPSQPELGYIDIQFKDMWGEEEGAFVQGTSTIIVPPTYQRTIQVLKELELYDGMVSDLQDVDKVIVLPISTASSTMNRRVETLGTIEHRSLGEIAAALARGDEEAASNYAHTEQPLAYGVMRDPEEIRSMYENGLSQLYAAVSWEELGQSYAVAVFVKDGVAASYKIVPMEAVPHQTAESIRQYCQNEYLGK